MHLHRKIIGKTQGIALAYGHSFQKHVTLTAKIFGRMVFILQESSEVSHQFRTHSPKVPNSTCLFAKITFRKSWQSCNNLGTDRAFVTCSLIWGLLSIKPVANPERYSEAFFCAPKSRSSRKTSPNTFTTSLKPSHYGFASFAWGKQAKLKKPQRARKILGKLSQHASEDFKLGMGKANLPPNLGSHCPYPCVPKKTFLASLERCS